MREHGLSFTAESIAGIQDLRKTQTRRVISPQPVKVECGPGGEWWDASTGRSIQKYHVGDRIWCKERWLSYTQRTPEQEAAMGRLLERTKLDTRPDFLNRFVQGVFEIGRDGAEQFLYAADFGPSADDPDCDFHWKSPRFMPKRAARIWLEVVKVRVERVQEISIPDVIAEGIDLEGDHAGDFANAEMAINAGLSICCRDPEIAPFAKTWDVINGKRPDCDWASNPWVRAITFKLAQQAKVAA